MTISIFVAIDVETTLNGNDDVGLAHPMHPDNEVVAFGMCYDGSKPYATYDAENFVTNICELPPGAAVCGHNLSFDLMYLYRTSMFLREELQDRRIWDTQLAEYILSAQQTKWSSLDELSVQYGLPVKDDKIKKYFEKGLGSDKIPSAELIPYLEQDVINTAQIARLQYARAIEAGQLTLIETQMEALHATTEMQYNGLHIIKQ